MVRGVRLRDGALSEERENEEEVSALGAPRVTRDTRVSQRE